MRRDRRAGASSVESPSGVQFGVQTERLDPILSATQVSSEPMNADFPPRYTGKSVAGGRTVAGSSLSPAGLEAQGYPMADEGGAAAIGVRSIAKALESFAAASCRGTWWT